MSRRHYVGICLLSLSTLLLELALTRVLSVALWYHFGFLVISMAMLGFGASGVTLTLWAGLRDRVSLDRTLLLLSIGFGTAIIVSYWVMQYIPFDPFSHSGDLQYDAVRLPFYYLGLAFPFFWSGLAIALLLTRGARDVNKLYAADLLGAGVGCAALPIVLPPFGGSGTVVCAAALAWLSAAVFGWREKRVLSVLAIGLCAGALLVAPMADRVIPISVAASKGHPLIPPQPRPEPLVTAWNSISRIEVYPIDAAPEAGWPAPGFGVSIDGGSAATGMGDLHAGIPHWLQSPQYKPPGYAYVGKAHPSVLIIGSGAGREVLEALYYGASSVTAVELNPIITDLVSGTLRETLGGLFEQPGVHLVTEEGRSFVRRSREQFDAIVSVQTNSNTALAAGALGLAEGYMFTEEAMEDYLDHLTPDGVLLITRIPNQVQRLFATARHVFERRGLGSPAGHVVALQTPVVPWGPRFGLTVFLLKKSPWTREEVQALAERVETKEQGVLSPRWQRGVLYAPFYNNQPSVYRDLLEAADVKKVYDVQSLDLSPVTDDRPFFNQQERWGRLGLIRTLNNAGTWTGSEAVLILLLFQTTIIAAVFILLPLARFSRQGLHVSGQWTYLLYFSGLGLGFIMIEIALFQRFILFLGEPVYAMGTVLGSLLVFTGVGAFAGHYVSHKTGFSVTMMLLMVLTVLAGTYGAMTWLFRAALGFSLGWRLLIAVFMLAPLGLMLGMPFPAGLRVVGIRAPSLVPWAWGINGFFTVIGSVIAMMGGMIFGFTTVLAVAGGCYALCLLATRIGRWQDESHLQEWNQRTSGSVSLVSEKAPA